jgi:hypothetical protein
VRMGSPWAEFVDDPHSSRRDLCAFVPLNHQRRRSDILRTSSTLAVRGGLEKFKYVVSSRF